MIILIDIDGPLADFEQGFLNLWKKRYPNLPFINIKDRKTFKIKDQYPLKFLSKIENIYYAQKFALNLPLVKGAKDFIDEMYRGENDIFLCSTTLSKSKSNFVDKHLWVEKNLGYGLTKKIIMTNDKTLIRGDLLIDDNPKIRGALVPLWKQVIFDAPYNKHLDLPRISNDWNNWRKILF